MASVNKVIVLGNLGRDPEVRYSTDGAAITNISIATSSKYKDKSGEMREDTEWHRIVFFGRLAEIAGQYLKKGRSVYVEGRLKTRKWQDQSGADRYTTEIVADQMQLLGGREDSAGGAPALPDDDMGAPSAPPARRAPAEARSAPPAAASGGGFGDLDDDIPF